MGEKNENYEIDRISFEMGMINCFVEMVANGVKKLALSPPIIPEDYSIICSLSEKIVTGFGINSYLEKSLLVTDLQSEDFTKGKWSILYYDKDEQNLSAEFMRLLSYPKERINRILAREKSESPYMLELN